jgi:hypothetical protein
MPLVVDSEVDVNDVIELVGIILVVQSPVISLTCICTTRHTGPEFGLTPKKQTLTPNDVPLETAIISCYLSP